MFGLFDGLLSAVEVAEAFGAEAFGNAVGAAEALGAEDCEAVGV